MKKIKQIIGTIISAVVEIFHPDMWTQLVPYCEDIDNDVRRELASSPVWEFVDKYTVKMNGTEYWIANRPYGFQVYMVNGRPSRKTIRMFYRQYDAAKKGENK